MKATRVRVFSLPLCPARIAECPDPAENRAWLGGGALLGIVVCSALSVMSIRDKSVEGQCKGCAGRAAGLLLDWSSKSLPFVSAGDPVSIQFKVTTSAMQVSLCCFAHWCTPHVAHRHFPMRRTQLNAMALGLEIQWPEPLLGLLGAQNAIVGAGTSLVSLYMSCALRENGKSIVFLKVCFSHRVLALRARLLML